MKNLRNSYTNNFFVSFPGPQICLLSIKMPLIYASVDQKNILKMFTIFEIRYFLYRIAKKKIILIFSQQEKSYTSIVVN